MVKRHIYRDNLILEYARFDYTGFILNAEDEDIEDKSFETLDAAKQWIDKNLENNGTQTSCRQ